MSEFIPPALLQSAKGVPTAPGWIFELKLDGFRALAYLDNGKGDLVSRNRNTFASFRNLASEVAGSFRAAN